MRITVVRKPSSAPRSAPLRSETYREVVDFIVEPEDADNRTQAERNADNAARASRLGRVEAELQAALAKLDDIEAKGGVRLTTSSVRTVLERAMLAPIA